MQAHVEQRSLACQGQWDLGAGRAELPDLAEQVGERSHTLAGNFEHHVALTDAGALRRPVLGQPADDDLAAGLRRIHAHPWAGREARPPQFQHVVQDRLEHVDGNDHVALRLLAFVQLVDEQRADAEQAAVHVHHRRPSPLWMRGGDEQRLVEHVFPVTGEFALVGDFRFQCVRPPAVADGDDVVASAAGSGIAARHCRYAELAERLHQP